MSGQHLLVEIAVLRGSRDDFRLQDVFEIALHHFEGERFRTFYDHGTKHRRRGERLLFHFGAARPTIEQRLRDRQADVGRLQIVVIGGQSARGRDWQASRRPTPASRSTDGR